MSNAADGYLGDWLPHKEKCGCADCQLERSEKRDIKLRADNKALLDALKAVRRNHLEIEDSWYSCPKSAEGCADGNAGSECTCGADEVNAIIDAAISQAERP